MKTPAALTARAVAALRIGAPECTEPILLTVMDGPDVRCFTEPMLDTWWANLTAAEKATIYERDLEGDPMELVMHDGLMRGSLADLVERIDSFSSRFQQLGVLRVGKVQFDSAALMSQSSSEPRTVRGVAEGMAPLGDLHDCGDIVVRPFEQGAVVLAQVHTVSPEDHVAAQDDAVWMQPQHPVPILPRLRPSHVSHSGEDKAKFGGNPVDVACA